MSAAKCRGRIFRIFCTFRTRGTGLRLAVLTSGAALGLTCLAPASAARPPAEPPPSARDVEQSRQDVRERAAAVGRTKAELAVADGELHRLVADAQAAVERYHGERLMLERARLAHRDAQRRLAEAGRRVDAARADLAAYAARMYRDGSGHDRLASVVAGRGGPQGFMDRAVMAKMLAQQRAGMVRRVEASRTVEGLFRRQAEDALARQGEAARRADEARRRAQDAVEKQQASVVRIEARKRELERRLGAAEARAAELKRARERALAESAAQKVNSAHADSGEAVPSGERGDIAARAALRWLGTPYSWGGGTVDGPSFGIEHGSGIRGFDCSGLAMYAWDKAGVRLDHWTGTQWTSGPHVPLDELRRGDLVFFARDTSDPDTIHHVGIYIGEGRMVEAPYTGARVRVAGIHRSDLIGATRPSG
ncbi:C40 family peptidase [Actinomadura sediminis]|uniref:NlpC/P60 family protein n=1 Tax=Actinomadura sediminis TaxID=1038904 RepID=A0ABW3EIM8_9ACTN